MKPTMCFLLIFVSLLHLMITVNTQSSVDSSVHKNNQDDFHGVDPHWGKEKSELSPCLCCPALCFISIPFQDPSLSLVHCRPSFLFRDSFMILLLFELLVQTMMRNKEGGSRNVWTHSESSIIQRLWLVHLIFTASLWAKNNYHFCFIN